VAKVIVGGRGARFCSPGIELEGLWEIVLIHDGVRPFIDELH
jgi:2-C-methyl-D-erythritol 4-phosphate cytidylyltransferase